MRRTSRRAHGYGRGGNFSLPLRACHSQLRLRSQRNAIHPDMMRSGGCCTQTRPDPDRFFPPCRGYRVQRSMSPPWSSMRSLRSCRLRITRLMARRCGKSMNKALPRGGNGDRAQLHVPHACMCARSSLRSRLFLGSTRSWTRRRWRVVWLGSPRRAHIHNFFYCANPRTIKTLV